MEKGFHSIYHPLDHDNDELRIVKLKSRRHNQRRGLDNEAIICELEPRKITEHCDWTALSYTWGTGPNRGSIVLAGQERPVSLNLQQALRSLRHENNDVILWIDQLSINQEDDVEKSQQVRKMTKIYQNATRVVSWIGIESDYSDIIFITLRHIAKAHGSAKKVVLSAVVQELRQSKISSHHQHDWTRQRLLQVMKTGLSALASRQYWRRLWVLQEVVVASDLCLKCGSQELTEHEFSVAWKRLGKTRQHHHKSTNDKEPAAEDHIAIAQAWQSDFAWWDKWLGITRLLSRRDYFQSMRDQWLGLTRHSDSKTSYQSATGASKNGLEPLAVVMYKTLTTFSGHVQMLCSDPRDRVFSLLGLAEDGHSFPSFPDYTRTTEEIYTEVARLILKQGRTDFLSFCQEDPDQRQRKLPSWATDWCDKIRILPWGKLGLHASSGIKFGLDFSVLNDKTIVLTGSRVGKIQYHGHRWKHDCPLSTSQTQVFLNELEDFCAKSRSIRKSDIEFVCAQVAAPTALALLHSRSSMVAEYKTLRGRLERTTHAPVTAQPPAILENVSIYEKELRLQLYRCPFITDTGYVGIGPAHLEKGDTICIFPNASAPTILRRAKNGDAFIVAGGAHIHGIMKGEYFEVTREARPFKLI